MGRAAGPSHFFLKGRNSYENTYCQQDRNTDQAEQSQQLCVRARRDWQRNWELYVIIIPVLIYFILFQYKPMYGALIAFKNYKPALGFLGSPWVGLDNFTRFFTSPFFGRLVRNTLLLTLSCCCSASRHPSFWRCSSTKTIIRVLKRAFRR